VAISREPPAGNRWCDYVARHRASENWRSAGPPEAIEQAGALLDPERPDPRVRTALRDLQAAQPAAARPERLLRLLTDRERPVQLVIAGKAHPADLAGQALIQQWSRFIAPRQRCAPMSSSWSDYDMPLTEHLVQGVDVWINTPRRPWEACGTSGMKVLVNGCLNLSELDGWWAEAYSPEVGWALGDGQEHGDDPAWDARGRPALRSHPRARGDPGVLYAVETGHPRGVGGSHAREHGASDASLQRQSRGARIPAPGAPGSFAFSAVAPAARPAQDYTARAIPHRDGVATPLEEARILWQR
jgi:starch phosphorylase